MNKDAEQIVEFWLSQDNSKYFQKDSEFDEFISTTYGGMVTKALAGELYDEWSSRARSCLALIILLDQFTRNIYRDLPHAYFGDMQARTLSNLALKNNYLSEFEGGDKQWFLMPLMHSENLNDQERSVEIFTKYELTQSIPFAKEHHDIIKQFGRFPHRNLVLNRESTEAEKKYLKNGGFTGKT